MGLEFWKGEEEGRSSLAFCVDCAVQWEVRAHWVGWQRYDRQNMASQMICVSNIPPIPPTTPHPIKNKAYPLLFPFPPKNTPNSPHSLTFFWWCSSLQGSDRYSFRRLTTGLNSGSIVVLFLRSKCIPEVISCLIDGIRIVVNAGCHQRNFLGAEQLEGTNLASDILEALREGLGF